MPRAAGLGVVGAVQVADVFRGVDNDAVLGTLVIVNLRSCSRWRRFAEART